MILLPPLSSLITMELHTWKKNIHPPRSRRKSQLRPWKRKDAISCFLFGYCFSHRWLHLPAPLHPSFKLYQLYQMLFLTITACVREGERGGEEVEGVGECFLYIVAFFFRKNHLTRNNFMGNTFPTHT